VDSKEREDGDIIIRSAEEIQQGMDMLTVKLQGF
jgi:hypothetical protein